MFESRDGYCRDADGFTMNPIGAFERHGRSMRLLKKGGSAPAPDPNIGIAAQREMDLAEKQYKDFSENYQPVLIEETRNAIRVANEQNRRQEELQDYTLGRSKVYDDRWDNVQVPLEDEIIGQARAYNEAGEQERMAAQAGEDVAVAFGNARGQTERALQARGLSMGSGAVISALGNSNLTQAMASASAVNKTREAAKQIGWTKLGEAAALGRGLPGFGSASAGLSLNAGQAALGAGTAGLSSAATGSGANSAGYTASGNMYGQAAGALNQQFATLSNNYNQAQNASASGAGAIIGAVGTAAAAFF